MRKIAIIKVRDLYHGYEDCDRIIEKITDFEEVSEETYKKLSLAEREFGFTIIEQVIDASAFITKTVADYEAMVEKREEAKRKLAAAEDKRREENKRKKELKTKEARLRSLIELVESQVKAGALSREEADVILSRNK